MTAANTVARSAGVVILVRRPNMDELDPVPMPEENTEFTILTYGIETWAFTLWKGCASLS